MAESLAVPGCSKSPQSSGKSKIPAVGIDLGTSYSVVAVHNKNHSEPIPNEYGRRVTPSCIYYQPQDGKVVVGMLAYKMGISKIENFVFENKRLIGRKYNDVYVQQLKSSPKIRFKVVEGENEKAEIAINHSNEIWRKTPEEISSEILKHLKKYASNYLGGEVTEAVISVPAHFSNSQRKATKTAAELAGLTVLKLITEPVAAAIHFANDKLEEDTATMLVFDIGGGTTDVSIIQVKDKAFTVKSIEGDSFLGGNDFDNIISKHFTNQIVQTFGERVLNRPLLRRRIENMSRNIKENLSLQPQVSIPMDCIDGDVGCNLTLTRAEMQEMCQELFDKAWRLVEKCLHSASMTPDNITDVLLVGGSSRIPYIKQMLTINFPNSQIRTDFNPDEAVALGAALQAATMTTKDFEKYEIIDVTPFTLGVAQDMDLMMPLLRKNTKIPCRSRAFPFASTFNNQKHTVFEIYEGERKNCKFNNHLGTFEVDNLPPRIAGGVVCEVIFTLDADGILEVEATAVGSNNPQKVTVTLGEFRLCDQQLKETADKVETNKLEDDLFEKFVNLVWIARTDCFNIMNENTLRKVKAEGDRETVLAECEQFLKVLFSYNYKDLDILKVRYKNFKDVVNRYVRYHFW